MTTRGPRPLTNGGLWCLFCSHCDHVDCIKYTKKVLCETSGAMRAMWSLSISWLWGKVSVCVFEGPSGEWDGDTWRHILFTCNIPWWVDTLRRLMGIMYEYELRREGFIIKLRVRVEPWVTEVWAPSKASPVHVCILMCPCGSASTRGCFLGKPYSATGSELVLLNY